MAFTKLDNGYYTHSFMHSAAMGTAVEQNVTDGAATVYSVFVDNTANGSAASYLKMYDTLPDGGIVQASTEPDYIFQVAQASRRQFLFPAGLPISNGLSLRCVADPQTNNVAGPGSSVVVTVLFK
tara:strand:- start:4782 stop:5156 length:375 start_codon:yes stop_codon:yes gene_type:complete